jgi:hypothetical protein
MEIAANQSLDGILQKKNFQNPRVQALQYVREDGETVAYKAQFI